MKKFLKVILYILSGLVIIVLILAGILWAKSPGKAYPFTDSKGNTIPGSISVIEKVMLGGEEQYLIIRGADSTKPVMLFLHGGPGSPEYAFMKQTNQAIENEFVMVYWEQRGAGKSFNKNIQPESMTVDQFISDTKDLSEMLAERFNKEKIYLTGHSWGSLLGILTAYEYPELFYAYIGVGQVCNQYKGEQISFEWVKEQAKIKNDEKAVKELSEMNFPDSSASIESWLDFLMLERIYVTQFGGGVTREMTGMWPVIKMVLDTKEYTFGDKLNFMRGSMFSLEQLWPEVLEKNLNNDIDSMQVSVYIFQGKFDYQTPYSVAKDFYDQLKAPKKDFFPFENSAHSPLMEEPDKFNDLLKMIVEENK